MDVDVARWVLEFLFRNFADDCILDRLIRFLPFPANDAGLQKTIILRAIESESSKHSISEKILELLERMEQVYYEEGVEVSEAMKAAYCSVAVACTVRFLEDDEKEEYFAAVKRIWRRRVAQMEDSQNVGLISENLARWRDEIEASLFDDYARNTVLLKNERNDAIAAVRLYVAEEKVKIAPSFLELAAKTLVGDATLMEALASTDNGDCERAGTEVGDGVANQPNSGKDVDVSDHNNEIGKEIVLSRRKHVARRRPRGATCGTSRGAKIADTGEAQTATQGNRCDDNPQSPNVDGVKAALESSSLELHAAVNDPLPGALQMAEAVIASMTGGNADDNSSGQIQTILHEDPPNSSVVNSAKACQNDNNLGNQCSMHQNYVPRPSLMARNSTAHTYEWDDSIDNTLEGPLDCSNRFHLPSPKRTVVSPLKKHEMPKISKRRKMKKWSTLEEDTLRAAVGKYGAGNWKFILNTYRDIFEERTEVDLKDKWRNLTRH